MMEIVVGVLAGIVNGAITALLGYAKSYGAVFDAKKALQTVIIGAFIGGVAGYTGWTYTKAEEWASSVGAITIVEYVKKAVLRRVFKEV